VSTPSFSALVTVCIAVLLGLRFALAWFVPEAAAGHAEVEAREPGSAMEVPPKPGGLAPTDGGSGSGDAALTPATCEEMPQDLRSTCWQALARQTAGADPEEALRVCERLAAGASREECQSDVAETIAPRARTRAAEICAAVGSTKWRGQCHFGMGLALAEVDAEAAMKLCDDAEAFRTFCRHDVVGEIAMVDLPAALTICGREEGNELTRKTCWHGMGKYLARRDLAEAAGACLAGPTSWQRLCFHGMGWGAAERDVDAALSGCAAFGEYADNCRHGVANQLKRSDPARGLEICESLTQPEARAKCLAFVTQ
jgi:hypothetical protein